MKKLALATLLLAGCLKGTYNCTTSSQCGASGVCEPAGYCAFPDTNCRSGLRYGDLSGPDSRLCVGLELPPDGGSDGSGSCTADTDGDGIKDCMDNCPTVANAGQENEDGDKFGDACDPCPPVADDNPTDTDGDGVADACDPRPTMAGDSILLFEGFHHGVPAGWEMVGTWTAANDDVSVATANNQIAELSTPGPTTKKDTVSASFTVETVDPTLGYAGVIDDHMPGSDGIECIPYVANGFNPSPGLAEGLMFSTTNFMVVAYELAAGATYKLDQRRDMQMFTCRAISSSGATAMATRTFTTDYVPASAGIEAIGGTYHFHWVMIVSNP